jgi:hypothetical protein
MPFPCNPWLPCQNSAFPACLTADELIGKRENSDSGIQNTNRDSGSANYNDKFDYSVLKPAEDIRHEEKEEATAT